METWWGEKQWTELEDSECDPGPLGVALPLAENKAPFSVAEFREICLLLFPAKYTTTPKLCKGAKCVSGFPPLMLEHQFERRF